VWIQTDDNHSENAASLSGRPSAPDNAHFRDSHFTATPRSFFDNPNATTIIVVALRTSASLHSGISSLWPGIHAREGSSPKSQGRNSPLHTGKNSGA
jgi:hypothetical protein